MKKIILALVAVLAIQGAFAGGKKDSVQSEPVTVGVLNGPSGIPSAYLIENAQALSGRDVTYQTFAQANLLLPKLISGEVDIGFLPPNVAAKTFSSTNGSLVAIGVAGNGMLSLITKDASVTSLEDLRGKTVAVAGQGATPEYLFKYLLSKHNIEVGSGSGKVELDFSIPNPQIAAALISGKIDYAVVPEPFSTVALSQDSSVRRAIDLQNEYAALGGEADYPMTLIVARSDFAKENPAFIKAFQKKYNEAQAWTKKNPEQAGELTEKAELGLKAQVVAKAIPTASFTYEAPTAAKKRIESLLNVFLLFAPESIGGALPSDEFYYSAK